MGISDNFLIILEVLKVLVISVGKYKFNYVYLSRYHFLFFLYPHCKFHVSRTYINTMYYTGILPKRLTLRT